MPVDLGAMRSSGIQAIAYNRLKAHLSMEGGQTLLYDIMQQLAQPEMAIVDRFHLDALPLPRATLGLDPARPFVEVVAVTRRLAGARFPDGLEADTFGRTAASRSATTADHILYRMPPAGLSYKPVYEPLAHATTIAEIEAWQPPSISDTGLTAWLAAEARRLRATTDKAIVGPDGTEGAPKAPSGTSGWQRFMEDLAGQPAHAEALLQRLADAACADLARYLDAVGEYIDIVQVGDDLGARTARCCRPAVPRAVKPYHQRAVAAIKRLSGKPLLLHSCGSISAHSRPDRGGSR